MPLRLIAVTIASPAQKLLFFPYQSKMLTSIGRAAARRITTTPLSATSSRLLSHNVAAVTCPAVAARAFTVSAWTRLPASKTPPKKKTKAAATKKATAKKTTTTKAKPKAVKSKAVKPKPKPKPKPKAKVGPKSKALTPEEQEKLDIRELKRWALLNKITGLPETAWLVYIAQEMKPGEKDLVGKMSQISASFKNLYSYEREVRKKILGRTTPKLTLSPAPRDQGKCQPRHQRGQPQGLGRVALSGSHLPG